MTVANWDIHSVSANEEEEERRRVWMRTLLSVCREFELSLYLISRPNYRDMHGLEAPVSCLGLAPTRQLISPQYLSGPVVLQQTGRPRLFANRCLCLFPDLTEITNSPREMGAHTPVLLPHPRGGREKQRQALKRKKK